MRKIAAIGCALALTCGLMAGCAGASGQGPAASGSGSSGAAASVSAAASASASASGAEPSQGAADVADGTYALDVKTDSSMVNVVESELSVEGGELAVTMSLNGEGFSRVYLGSAEDAAGAPDSDIYDYTLNEEGKYTFTFPIEALGQDTDVALFGQRRDTWYDHVLVFSLAQ